MTEESVIRWLSLGQIQVQLSGTEGVSKISAIQRSTAQQAGVTHRVLRSHEYICKDGFMYEASIWLCMIKGTNNNRNRHDMTAREASFSGPTSSDGEKFAGRGKGGRIQWNLFTDQSKLLPIDHDLLYSLTTISVLDALE